MKTTVKKLFTALLSMNLFFQSGTAVSAETDGREGEGSSPAYETVPAGPVLSAVYLCDEDNTQKSGTLIVNETPTAVSGMAGDLGTGYVFTGEVTVVRPDAVTDSVSAIGSQYYTSKAGLPVYYSDVFPGTSEIRFTFHYRKKETDSKKTESGTSQASAVRLTVSDGSVNVTASAKKSAGLSENTVLHADYLSPGSSAYQKAVSSFSGLGLKEGSEFVLYDVYFTEGEKRIKPADSVSITMTFLSPIQAGDSSSSIHSARIVRVSDSGKGEVLNGNISVRNGGIQEIRYTGKSFSAFGVSYTLSHVYDSYSWVIREKSEVSLSSILNELSISASSLTDVRSSDSSVLAAEPYGEDWIIRADHSFEGERTLTVTDTEGSTYVISIRCEALPEEEVIQPESIVQDETNPEETIQNPQENQNSSETAEETDSKDETVSEYGKDLPEESKTEPLSISIVKTDAEDPKTGVAGAVWGLFDENGPVMDQLGNPVEFTTDHNGRFLVKGSTESGWTLEENKTYTLREITAAEGYEKDSEPFEFRISSDTESMVRNTYLNGTELFLSARKASAEKASITVKASFSGLSVIPDFRITNGYENGIMTAETAEEGTGTDTDPFVWTLKEIPSGTEIAFAATNLAKPGFSVRVNGNPYDEEEGALVTAAADPKQTSEVLFACEYTAESGSVTISHTVSGAEEEEIPSSYRIAVLGKDGAYYLPDGKEAETPEDAFVVFHGRKDSAVWNHLPEGDYVILEDEAEVSVRGYVHEFTGDTEFSISDEPAVITRDVETIYRKDQGVFDLTLFLESGSSSYPVPEEAEKKEFRAALRNTETMEFYRPDGSIAETQESIWIPVSLSNPSRWINLPSGIYAVDIDMADLEIEGYEVTHHTDPKEGYVQVDETNTADHPAELTDTVVYTKVDGSLVITKTVSGLPAKEKNREYRIALRDGDNVYYSTDGSIAGPQPDYVSFLAGESIAWNGLKDGTYYIEEDLDHAQIDGYELNVKGTGEVTVSTSALNEAEVHNNYRARRSDLVVNLYVYGAPSSADSKAYRIALRDAAGTYYKSDGTIAGTSPVYITIHNGESRSWEGLSAGTYTLEEDLESALISGYALNVEGTGKIVLSDTGTKTVDIENTYSSAGTLSVTNTVSGAPSSASSKTYGIAVKDAYGRYYRTSGSVYGTSPHYVSFKAGETRNWNNLPAGIYTVEENTKDAEIENYSLKTTGTGSYSVAGGKKVTANVLNRYTVNSNTGNVLITKIVRGAPMSAAGQQYRIAVKSTSGFYYYQDGTRASSQADAWVSFIAGETKPWLNLPVGKYVLEEELSSAAISGFTLSIASSGTFEVKKTHTAKSPLSISLTNTYREITNNSSSNPSSGSGSGGSYAPASTPSSNSAPVITAVPSNQGASSNGTGTPAAPSQSSNGTESQSQNSSSGSGSTAKPDTTDLKPSASPNTPVIKPGSESTEGIVLVPDNETASAVKKKEFPTGILIGGGAVLFMLIAGLILVLTKQVKEEDDDISEE